MMEPDGMVREPSTATDPEPRSDHARTATRALWWVAKNIQRDRPKRSKETDKPTTPYANERRAPILQHKSVFSIDRYGTEHTIGIAYKAEIPA